MAQKQRLFKLKGMKFEIAELEMQVSGEDAEQQLRSALNDEFNRFLAPVTQALRPQLESTPSPAHSGETAVNVTPERRNSRRTGRKGAGPSGSAVESATPLDWKPDIKRFGNPSLSWSTFEKGAWLLHCYAKDHAAKGLSAPVIVATFNKHFPHSKTITQRYLNRDFGRQAAADRPKVTVDNNQTPPVWFLTDVGVQQVEEQIKRASTPVLVSGAA